MGYTDQHWKALTGFQGGDIVRVEQEKEAYWKGKIINIHTFGTMANVEMINPNSVGYGRAYCVRIGQLKIWDPADDVNV